LGFIIGPAAGGLLSSWGYSIPDKATFIERAKNTKTAQIMIFFDIMTSSSKLIVCSYSACQVCGLQLTFLIPKDRVD